MIVSFKLLLVGGAIAALPFAIAENSTSIQANEQVAATAPQDPVVEGFRQEATWNFAELEYVTHDGTTRRFPARRITKLWVLRRSDGGICLEVLYENQDYSFVLVREFHVIRRSGTVSSVDVPVVRSELTGMAFPAFR